MLSLEYSSEQSDPKKEKSSFSKKLHFRRNQENVKDKEKEKRKPKRTASVNGPSGYSIVDYRGKRSKGNTSPLSKRLHNRHNSVESSIVSATNLGGSVPYDLPGTVDVGDVRLEFNSLGGDRPGSTLTLEDVSISMSQPEMVDVAIQCSPGGSSITRYHPPASPLQSRTKGEHTKRLHSVNTLSVDTSPLRTQSLPGTPIKKRRSPDILGGGSFGGREPKSPPVPFLLEHSRRQYTNTTLLSRSKEIQELRKGLPNGSLSAEPVLTEVSC